MLVSTREDRDEWQHRRLERVGGQLRLHYDAALRTKTITINPLTEAEADEMIAAGIEAKIRMRTNAALTEQRKRLTGK